MDDRFIKYTKLSIIIFLLFLAVPLMFSLVFGVFYGLSAIISSRPIDIVFEIFIISCPAILFSTVYTIFFIRTKSHPSVIVKYISYFIFVSGIALSCYFLITDLLKYFTKPNANVTDYHSFGMIFLSGNIAAIFLTGVMQAFTTKKEKDWMERANARTTSQN
jgi:hypothetical protein